LFDFLLLEFKSSLYVFEITTLLLCLLKIFSFSQLASLGLCNLKIDLSSALPVTCVRAAGIFLGQPWPVI
jgi:hypothetical protein